jgi:hypothetical protein
MPPHPAIILLYKIKIFWNFVCSNMRIDLSRPLPSYKNTHFKKGIIEYVTKM